MPIFYKHKKFGRNSYAYHFCLLNELFADSTSFKCDGKLSVWKVDEVTLDFYQWFFEAGTNIWSFWYLIFSTPILMPIFICLKLNLFFIELYEMSYL